LGSALEMTLRSLDIKREAEAVADWHQKHTAVLVWVSHEEVSFGNITLEIFKAYQAGRRAWSITKNSLERFYIVYSLGMPGVCEE